METFAGKPIIDPALLDAKQGNSVTKTVDSKPVLRPSSLNIQCPYSYAQSAILGKKSKPSGASSGGTAYHYALELGYEHKIQTGLDPKPDDVVEIGRENWRKVQEVEELHWSSKDNPDKMTDDITKGLKRYAEVTMPTVQPIATEIRWSVQLPKPSRVYSIMSGSVDLLAKSTVAKPILGGGVEYVNGVEIVDHKFTSKKATEPKYRMQAMAYEIMGKANGVDVQGTALHNMVRSQQLKTKVNPPKLEIVRPTRDDATKNLVVSRIHELIDRGEVYYYLVHDIGIDPEDAVKVVYPTTTPEVSFLCSELWCGWWSSCPMNNPDQRVKFSLVDMLKSKGGR